MHYFSLGKYNITRDGAGQLIVTRLAASSEVHVLPQSQAVDATDQMGYAAYIRRLRGKISANMQQSVECEDKYFHNVPLLSQPREYADQVKSGRISAQFHLFVPSYRWFEPDSGQPVSYIVDTDQGPAGWVASVDAALAAWSNQPGSALRAVDAGTTTGSVCSAAYGQSIVEIDNCDGTFSSGGTCQGLLGYGGFDAGDPSQTRVVNGTTFGRLLRGFAKLNPFSACYWADTCNMAEVLTHEVGHSLGLAHSWDPTFGGSPTQQDQAQTMYWVAHFDGRCASIMSDDKAAIVFVYPGSTSSSNSATVGVYSASSSTYFLRFSNSPGPADLVFQYGQANSGIPLVGDWTGSGVATVGFYDPATAVWSLKNTNSAGAADMVFQYGPANSGWIPLVGDWDGNGSHTVGLYDPATSVFFLKNTNSAGPADLVFQYGPANSGWTPLAGRWTGAAADTIGLYSPSSSIFFLKNSNSAGPADSVFQYGPANSGWTPVVGDWTGSGTDTVGFFVPSNATWFLKNSNAAGPADTVFPYGFANGMPLVGRWH